MTLKETILLKNKRIFMVEDKVENRSIMQLLLEQQGAKVAFERWGRDTVERLQAFAPVDLILLDLMLPNNVTGYDIFDRIKAVPEFSDIPIVAVSAMDAAVAIPRVREKGFAGFIAKPIEFDGFAYQIAQAINRKPIWNTLPVNR
jgi:CheY-like chemotaxis protein